VRLEGADRSGDSANEQVHHRNLLGQFEVPLAANWHEDSDQERRDNRRWAASKIMDVGIPAEEEHDRSYEYSSEEPPDRLSSLTHPRTNTGGLVQPPQRGDSEEQHGYEQRKPEPVRRRPHDVRDTKPVQVKNSSSVQSGELQQQESDSQGGATEEDELITISFSQ
jgi:hypothetical protein